MTPIKLWPYYSVPISTTRIMLDSFACCALGNECTHQKSVDAWSNIIVQCWCFVLAFNVVCWAVRDNFGFCDIQACQWVPTYWVIRWGPSINCHTHIIVKRAKTKIIVIHQQLIQPVLCSFNALLCDNVAVCRDNFRYRHDHKRQLVYVQHASGIKTVGKLYTQYVTAHFMTRLFLL